MSVRLLVLGVFHFHLGHGKEGMRSEVPDPEVTSKMPLSMCCELTSENSRLEDRSHEK